MTPENFAYWLQGYFELVEANEIAPLVSTRQKAVIRAHLELVKKCSKKPITGFCAWFDGALSVAPIVTSVISPLALSVIRGKLNDEFLHVIDPKVPGDKEELQAVHDGLQLPRPPRTDDYKVRC